jgi:hypothetical protein
VRLSPLGTAPTVCPIAPAPDDDDECGTVGGMRIGRGSTRTKPAPVPLCPPQISHGLSWARTQAAAVGSRRLTASAMARPIMSLSTGDSSVVHWLTLHTWSLISTDWLQRHLFSASLAEPLSTQLTVVTIVFKITPRHGHHGKHFLLSSLPCRTPLNLTDCCDDCLQDNSSARTPRKTFSVVKNACLLARSLAMDICEPHRKPLLRHWFYCCVRVFRALPRNGSTCRNIFYSTYSWSAHTVYAKCILWYTTIRPWSCAVDIKLLNKAMTVQWARNTFSCISCNVSKFSAMSKHVRNKHFGYYWSINFISFRPANSFVRCGIIEKFDKVQVGRSRVRFPIRLLDFPIDLILLATLWPRDRLSL